jgi:hypothetical protein
VRDILGRIGGSVMAAAFASAVGWLITSEAPSHTSPPPTWPYWLCGGMFVVGALMFAGARGWLGWLSRRFRRLPPLVPTVEDEDWFLFRQAGYVCGLLIKIKNTTGQRVTVVSYGIGMDWPSNPDDAPAAFSAENDRVLSEQARIRREGGRYDPLLTAQPATIPPRSEVSGWLVTHSARPSTGGRPRCIIQVTDSFGNKYRKVIEQRDPQHYDS